MGAWTCHQQKRRKKKKNSVLGQLLNLNLLHVQLYILKYCWAIETLVIGKVDIIVELFVIKWETYCFVFGINSKCTVFNTLVFFQVKNNNYGKKSTVLKLITGETGCLCSLSHVFKDFQSYVKNLKNIFV